MNTDTLALISRILITFSIFSQIAYMIYYKSIKISPITFVTYALASYLMTYVYYKNDGDKFTNRSYFKLVNSTGLLIIAILVLKEQTFINLS
jgi:4-hydroxybenzoate polyprenyltransferase